MFFKVFHDSVSKLSSKKELAALPHPEWIPAQLLDYARDSNGVHFEWSSPDDGSGRPKCWGCIWLQPITAIYGDWYEHIYFASTPADSRLRHFKVVDWCSPETCVGLYHDAHGDPGLYLYTPGNGDEPYPLHLDLRGYVQLLELSYGYHLWPMVLLAQLPDDGRNPAYHTATDHAAEFRRDLGAWLPWFDYEQFVALYQRVRLPAA